MDFSGLSINEHARRFLSNKSTANDLILPKELHDALQNVFTKTRSSENADKTKFRRHVIYKESDSPTKYVVQHGKNNAIYNSLCLLYLIGTGETKKLFQHYEATKQTPEKRDFSILKKQTHQQYLEFFCLGVVRENIDKIIEDLSSKNFNLYTDKLPSPFSSSIENKYDLSPLLKLYSQKIPWQEYMLSYEKAEEHFSNKKFSEAQEELDKLEKKSVVRLPVVESLNKKISEKLKESKEAWDYLQKILN